MSSPAEIARQTIEIVNATGSTDEAMAGLESRMHPDIEWVNPEDAIEGGTRRGLAGMRLMFDNFFAGFGGASTMDIEEVEGRGDHALVISRPHVRGESSGADVARAAGGPDLHDREWADLQDRMALRHRRGALPLRARELAPCPVESS